MAMSPNRSVLVNWTRRLHNQGKEDEAEFCFFQNMCIDGGSHQVWVDDQLIVLTTDLLKAVAKQLGMVLSCERLQKKWGG